MDVAVAVLYCKHSNSIDKLSSTDCLDTNDFEILLEENYATPSTGPGGTFIPSDESDIFRPTTSSFSTTSSGGSGNENRFSVSSREYRPNVNGNSANLSAKMAKYSPSDRLLNPGKLLQQSAANNFGKLLQHLPRKSITFDQEPSEIATVFSCQLFSKTLNNDPNNNSVKIFRRAVPVALWKSEPSSPQSGNLLENGGDTTSQNLLASGLSAALFCVPILEKEKVTCKCLLDGISPCQDSSTGQTIENDKGNSSAICTCRYRFHSLDKVLGMCRNASALIDPETRHLVLRLEEWLKLRSKQRSDFLSNLFLRRPASTRFHSCVHNPGHKEEIHSCQRQSKRPLTSSHPNYRYPRNGTAEIDEEVRSANTALACMMAIEKCDRLIMNPLFGSSLPYRVSNHHGGQQLSPSQYQYMAKNRSDPSISRPFSMTCGSPHNLDGSDSGSFVDEYPLHRASQVGQATVLRQLLGQHYDVNQLDRDYWAPIHYASWYGHLSAVQVLLNYGQNCSVNIRNKNGSTPLHFAAWCGHHYVVELLLSHPDIDPDLKDKDGKTALNLCECVPKPEWQSVADLLRTVSKKKRLQLTPKVQVDLADGSNAMLCLTDGEETTAEQLHEQMCQELQLTEECGKLFAIWICSESLQLQLKGDHKPMQHMQRWKSKLWQWSDIADSVDYEERARLIFRRDARVVLKHEKKVKLTDAALALLFHEAHQNFLSGLYPCSDHDMVMLAATVLQIIHGEYDSKKDKMFLSSDNSMAKLLPAHKLKDRNFNWTQHIMSEHKHMSSSRAQNSLPALQYRYLSFCEKFRSYGSAFFTAVMFVDKPVKGSLYVHAGVNDAGLHLINCETKVLYRSFNYEHLTFTCQPERPFIKFRGKDNGTVHEFTLKTKQVIMINTLLCRFANRTSHHQTAVPTSSPLHSGGRNSPSSSNASSVRR